ncbi:WecB/TagA/CpsF family glycosyltransferase [Gordonia aurantiaca]|uniref:WecB/TagA/CpsF family glycosyltransferase n=1 Tax=Gordonia sp. B21 TaxID=3151852 RepID=UPI003266A482
MNNSNALTWVGDDLYIGGVPVVTGGADEVLEHVATLVDSGAPRLVVTPNVDHVIRLETCEDSRNGYAHADLALLDGVPVAKLAAFLGSRPVGRNTGADLLFDVCRRASQTGWRVVITGGRDSTARTAASNLARLTGADVVAVPFPFIETVADQSSEYVIAQLRELRPSVVFLCLGSPKQESWYAEWKKHLPPAAYVGSGAAVDFAADKVRRAPQFMQRCALEWVWRLASEPRRLWRRYLLVGPKFFPIAVQTAWASETTIVQRALACNGIESSVVNPDGAGEPATPVVVQIGPEPTGTGGMATVIHEYLHMDSAPFEQVAMPTWGRRRGVGSMATALHVALRLILSRRDWTIVHVHLSEFGSFVREGMIVLLARALRKPCVVSLHGADFERHVATYPRLTRLVLRSAATAICLGQRHQRLVRQIDPRIDTTIVLNPISSALIDETIVERVGESDCPTFVFAGEVGGRKGVDRLLDAWPTVKSALPDARLLIAGPLESGNTEIESRLLAATGHEVRYIGELGREDVTRELAAATVTVLPSRAEVLPMVILESLACGTPAVYTDVGEWETFRGMDEVTVVKLPESDEGRAAKVLAEAMIAAARDGDERQAIREACRKWARSNVSTTVVAEVLRSVYEAQLTPPRRFAGVEHGGER